MPPWRLTLAFPPQTFPTASLPPGLQPQGWLRYLSFKLDHKVDRSAIHGDGSFSIGGSALAGVIRVELLSSDIRFCSQETYNEMLNPAWHV